MSDTATTIIETVSTRHSHLVDPALHIWGWEVPVYLFLGGVAAGIMVLTGLIGLRTPDGERSRGFALLPVLAAALLSLGMGALFLDLELKTHVYRFYMAFRLTSPMSWGSWILMAVYPATILLGLGGLSATDRARLGPLAGIARWASERLAFLRTANIALGLGLGVYTGILLGTLAARAAWNSALLGPLFLVSGVSTGAALMMLLPVSKDEHRLLMRWDMLAIGAEIALIALFLLGLSTSDDAGRSAAEMFLGGAYTAPFWALVVIMGLGVPLLLETTEIRRHRPATVMAPVLVLIGGLALRWILVSAGQA